MYNGKQINQAFIVKHFQNFLSSTSYLNSSHLSVKDTALKTVTVVYSLNKEIDQEYIW